MLSACIIIKLLNTGKTAVVTCSYLCFKSCAKLW